MSRWIYQMLHCAGICIAALFFTTGTGRAGETIYGSGDFILNKGPVISDTGTWIGGIGETYSQTGSSVAWLQSNEGTLSPFVIEGYDQLPHTITVSAVNGSVTRFPDQPVYDFNTTVKLTATPDPGYVFEQWTVSANFGNTGPWLIYDPWRFSTTRGRTFNPRSASIFLDAGFDFQLVAHFVPATRVISVTGVHLSWDQQAVGESSAGSFKILNTGNAPLTVDSIDFPIGFNGN